MWFVYLLNRFWLWGSMLVPFMLAFLWLGSRWRGLRWLTGSRIRWVVIWSSFGFLSFAAGKAIQWMLYHSEFSRVGDSIFWEFLLGACLMTIREAAIDAALAAFCWWLYHWTSEKLRTHSEVSSLGRYGLALLFSTWALGIANNELWRRTTCFDCFAPHGVPFTYFHEGGFAGGEGFVLKGIIGNALVAVICALVLGWVWNLLTLKRTRAAQGF